MFSNFLEKLKPIHSIENDEWLEVLNLYEQYINLREPNLFWYLSSGIDLKALVHFNKKDTTEVYKTPKIDCFVFSDYYIGVKSKLQEYYNQLDDGGVCLYEDNRTYIELEQMIPLNYFSDDEVQNINSRYTIHTPFHLLDAKISGNIHFYYCLIRIDSNYFGEEYFPVLISPLENWILMEEVWKKQGVLFDYICGVCDGCCKGGAYKCVNEHYKDFLPIMKEKRRFWVSDHIHWESNPAFNDYKKYFRTIATLRVWGGYNNEEARYPKNPRHRKQILQRWGGGNYGRTSYLYEIIH